jgi:hypothetical protein
MKRDTLINILLVIAGILLAFALFGAGALWKGKTPRMILPIGFVLCIPHTRLPRFGTTASPFDQCLTRVRSRTSASSK